MVHLKNKRFNILYYCLFNKDLSFDEKEIAWILVRKLISRLVSDTFGNNKKSNSTIL
jgi:hypothetical protein